MGMKAGCPRAGTCCSGRCARGGEDRESANAQTMHPARPGAAGNGVDVVGADDARGLHLGLCAQSGVIRRRTDAAAKVRMRKSR